MKDKEIAEIIIPAVGGQENIKSLTHCVTRLRFSLIDTKKVDKAALDGLGSHILGHQLKNGEYQIIVGGGVAKVYKAVVDILPELEHGGDAKGAKNDAPADEKKRNIFSKLLESFSSILVSTITPVIGGGMLKGIAAMLTTFHIVDSSSDLYFLINMIADCMYYFFPFMIAVSAAKKFKTNQYMAIALAGILMYPTFLNAAIDGTMTTLHLIGPISIPVLNYSSSIFPTILGVWLLSHVFRFFEKHVPSAVTIVFSPMLTLIVTAPLTLLILAPLGYYAGEYIALFTQKVVEFSPVLAGFLIGSTRPLLVITGMHHAMRTITQQQRATYGYSNVSAMQFMSTMAQASTCLGVLLSTKDKNTRQVAFSAAISGYLGITEPALYGLIMRYRSCLIATLVGGGTGAAIGAAMGAKAFSSAFNVFSFPVFFGENGDGFLGAMVGWAATIVVTAGLTMVLWRLFNDEAKATAGAATTAGAVNPIGGLQGVEPVQMGAVLKSVDILSPVNGEIYPIEQVSDETFSKQIIGTSIAITPTEELITSPVEGVVSMIPSSNHAVGLSADDGAEVLIHVGIDTVRLDGKHFEMLCKEGQKVSIGDPLLRFDREKLKAEGYDDTVLVVVTNSEKYRSVAQVHTEGLIFKQEPVLSAQIG